MDVSPSLMWLVSPYPSFYSSPRIRDRVLIRSGHFFYGDGSTGRGKYLVDAQQLENATPPAK